MNDALVWLALSILATAVMWVPYILNTVAVRGVLPAMGYDENVPPLSSWATRAKQAHANAVENLVLFAPLVLGHAALGNRHGAVATAAMTYFVLRLAHYLVYVAKVPYARTLTFIGAWGAVVYLSIGLLTALI